MHAIETEHIEVTPAQVARPVTYAARRLPWGVQADGLWLARFNAGRYVFAASSRGAMTFESEAQAQRVVAEFDLPESATVARIRGGAS